jgi:hypothetical protein
MTSSLLLRVAVAAVRLWTRAYTWGMDAVSREGRRAEIESDLWESLHDEAPSDAAIARHILARLASGLLDDLRWRVEQPSLDSRIGAVLALGAIGVLVGGIWIFSITRAGKLPLAPPPPAPTARGFGLAPPPPPPPPPPRNSSAGAGSPPVAPPR